MAAEKEIAKKDHTNPDPYGLLKHNQRLRKLAFVLPPNILKEFLENFKLGNSLRFEKTSDNQYLVGLGKRHKRMSVEFRHQMWKCECGYLTKIGIPCSHLMRVLHAEKKIKYADYVHPSYLRLASSLI